MRLFLFMLILFLLGEPSVEGWEHVSVTATAVPVSAIDSKSQIAQELSQEYDSMDSVWVLIIVDNQGTYILDTFNGYAKRSKDILLKEKSNEDFASVLERKTKGKTIITLLIKAVEDLPVGILEKKFLSPYLIFIGEHNIKIKGTNEYFLLKIFRSYSELLKRVPQLEW